MERRYWCGGEALRGLLEQSTHRKAKEALRLFNDAVSAEPLAVKGGDRRSESAKENQSCNTTLIRGTTDYTLRRLKRDDPDLAKQVLDGVLSAKIFDLWLTCHTQQEIADAVGCAIGPVNEFLKSLQYFGNATAGEIETLSEIADDAGCDEKVVREVIGETAGLPNLRKGDIAAAEHATDFTPPIYNVWKQQENYADARSTNGYNRRFPISTPPE